MIYLDNCASTRVDDAIAEAVKEVMVIDYANPSSLHHFGMDAYRLVTDARARAGNLLGAPMDSIVFTSGGTDGNNLAILGSVYGKKGRIVTTAIEHSSVMQPMKELERQGYEVVYVRPNENTHRIEASDVTGAVNDDTILVSVMHANNETGEILPIEEISKGIKEKYPDVLIHVDCVQSFAKIVIPLYKWKIDLLTASGHKFHAPKGVGLLYIKPGVKLHRFSFGGAQEKGYRPGTENVPAITGIGLACERAMIHMKKEYDHVYDLNRHLRTLLSEMDNVVINSPEDALPYVLNISVLGHHSHDMINDLGMKDIYVSAGAACNKNDLSYVLEACGKTLEERQSALRISFSHENTRDELEEFVYALKETMKVREKKQ